MTTTTETTCAYGYRMDEPCPGEQCTADHSPPSVSAPQPAPDAGEWRWTYDPMPSHPQSYHIRERGNGDCVVHAATERNAAQIVSDHRSAAAVPKLVAALTTAKTVISASNQFHTWDRELQQIDEALSPVQGKEQG